MASSRRKPSGFSESMKTLVKVALFTALFRSFAFEPFYVPSKSMMPTLLVGDFIVVAKYSYGYSRHALPFSLHLFDGRLLFHPPRRGDVAVFKVPTDNRTDLIKRVIGLPGDHIRVDHRVLSINGVPVKRQEAEDYADHDPHTGIQLYRQTIETLPNGQAHIIIEDPGPEGVADNTGDYIVPPHHYFMMGDNRDNSQDSRYPEVGTVPEENLVGRAEFIFLSSKQGGSLRQFWRWPGRWNRFFESIV